MKKERKFEKEEGTNDDSLSKKKYLLIQKYKHLLISHDEWTILRELL